MEVDIREDIFGSLHEERERQDGLWGADFDDKNTANDWVSYVNKYAARAAQSKLNPGEFETAMRKIAAIAIAAIETCYRNDGLPPRHYD